MAAEVFRTNVRDYCDANMLVDQIHAVFLEYRANFDLEDCDRILRVESRTGLVDVAALVQLLKTFGFDADVLPDTIPELLFDEKDQ